MKYLHTMVRVADIDKSLRFYCDALGLKELSRMDNAQGRFTLIFLAAPGDESAQVELTHNWDPESYAGGRNFGHLAYAVDDIYASCQRLMDHGIIINRPPRDGRMAFVRSPDSISVELLQKGFGFVVCHINGPDEASHMRDVEAKIRSLEAIDRHIVGPVAEYFRERPEELGGVMVVPDHYTNVQPVIQISEVKM